jgi:hypothetical protein
VSAAEDNAEAVALWDRYDEVGELSLLDRAIGLLRRGLGEPGVPSAIQLILKHNLVGALLARALRSGRLEEVREAVFLAQEVARHTDSTDPRYPGRVNNVGYTLQQYFLRTRDTSVLAEAVAAFEVAFGFDASPAHAGNLAEALRHSFGVHRDPAVLDRAVALARSAAAVDRRHLLFARFQANLALLLHTRYRVTSDPAELIQARRSILAALAGTPSGHPNEAERMSTYVSVLHEIYRQHETASNLNAFRAAARRAEKVVPQEHPSHTGVLHLRALADFHQARTTGNRAAQATSRLWFRQGVDAVTLPVAERVGVARSWAAAALLHGDLAEAGWAFARAVELLPLTAARHLQPLDRQREIAQFSSLVSDAAACALAADDARLALTLLEQGRGVLIGQAVESWQELDRLEQIRPDLARTFRRLRLQPVPDDENDSLASSFADAEQRRQAAEEWDALLVAVRREPGFDDFLRAPSLDQLLTAGREGPVVIVNVSELRCDTLIVGPSGLRRLPMPWLDGAEVGEQATAFTEAVRSGRDPARSPTQQAAAEATARAVLAWLWRAVTGPILSELGLTGTRGPLPRLWWVSTGALALLPVHAAGEYAAPGAVSGDSALDHVVSSYTPTVRSLLHHRAQVAGRARDEPGPALVVALTSTPGAGALPGADVEARLLIDELWPDARILRDAAATRAAVLAALPGRRRVHFACHARSGGETALLLHDHQEAPLTLTDIAELHLTEADLAYLSACETTVSPLALADEAVHLTGAFHLAGFHHVIGTLWRAADDVSARVAQSCHRAVLATGTAGSARALHRAVQTERQLAPAVPTLWSAHLHTGI